MSDTKSGDVTKARLSVVQCEWLALQKEIRSHKDEIIRLSAKLGKST